MRAPACLRTALRRTVLRRTVVPLAALALCLTSVPADAMTARERLGHRGAGSVSAFLEVVTDPVTAPAAAGPGRTASRRSRAPRNRR
jgi:hypothetical protein